MNSELEPLETEIFLSDLQYFGGKSWQVKACKQAFFESKHYHRYLEINKHDGDLSITLEVPTSEVWARFVFSDNGMTIKVDKSDTGRFFPRNMGIGEIIAYAIDLLYETGEITNIDMITMSRIGGIESSKAKRANQTKAMKAIKDIEVDVKAGKYPQLNRIAVEVAEILVENIVYLHDSDVSIEDDGHIIMLTHHNTNNGVVELRIRPTTLIRHKFYINIRAYKDGKVIANKILNNDIYNISNVVNTAIAVLKIRQK